MFVKLMGFCDLMAAAVVLLLHYDIIGWRLGFLFVAYLLAKGWLFRTDIASLMDVLCGVYMFIMLFGFTTVISFVVAAYLFQKAVFSLAA